jgi:hypothetical protein
MPVSTIVRLISSLVFTLILLFFFGLGCYLLSLPLIGVSVVSCAIWFFGFLIHDINILVSFLKGNSNV